MGVAGPRRSVHVNPPGALAEADTPVADDADWADLPRSAMFRRVAALNDRFRRENEETLARHRAVWPRTPAPAPKTIVAGITWNRERRRGRSPQKPGATEGLSPAAPMPTVEELTARARTSMYGDPPTTGRLERPSTRRKRRRGEARNRAAGDGS